MRAPPAAGFRLGLGVFSGAEFAGASSTNSLILGALASCFELASFIVRDSISKIHLKSFAPKVEALVGGASLLLPVLVWAGLLAESDAGGRFASASAAMVPRGGFVRLRSRAGDCVGCGASGGGVPARAGSLVAWVVPPAAGRGGAT